MRICYITRILPQHEPGGMQDHLWALAKGVAQRGHEAHVISTTLPAGASAPDAPFRLHLIPGTVPGKYRGGFFRAAYEAFVRINAESPFDIIHSASFAADGFPDENETPLVATLHGVSLAETEYEPAVFRNLSAKRRVKCILRFPRIWYITRRMLSFGARADFIIVDSAFSKRELLRVAPRVREESVRVIYCGIDTERFAPIPKEDARRALGLGDGRYALTVSRLDPQKGIQIALRAFERLRDLDVTLLVAGDGSYRPTLERTAREKGLTNVIFLGRVHDADLARYYGATDLFLYPELTQPAFGLVAAEAMSAGCTVIGSDHGAIPEVIGDAGRLFPPGDNEALAGEIRSFFESENPSESALAARNRVCEHFALDRMIDETLQCYENMLTRRT